MSSISEFLDYAIFHWGNYTLKLYNLVSVIVLIGLLFLILFLVKKGIRRIGHLEESRKFVIYKLTQYILWVIVLIISLQLLGFNLSVLMAGSAALLVGLGFGMQNLFSDFVSGIILLLDGTIKVGDIIEVNDRIFLVKEIKFRTTIVIGRDENYVVLPNTELTKNRVINWTYSNVSSRFNISLSVDYSSDIEDVSEILKAVALHHEGILPSPAPFVRFEDFGDSGLLFSVYFWTDEVYRVENIKSDLRFEIFEKMKEKGIVIPFPQRVVHVKSEKGDI